MNPINVVLDLYFKSEFYLNIFDITYLKGVTSFSSNIYGTGIICFYCTF